MQISASIRVQKSHEANRNLQASSITPSSQIPHDEVSSCASGSIQPSNNSNKYSHRTRLQNKTWWAGRRLKSLNGNRSHFLGLKMLLLLLFKYLWGTDSCTAVQSGLLCHSCRFICVHLQGGRGFQWFRWKEARGTLTVLGGRGDLGDDRHLDWGGGWGGSGGGGAAWVEWVMLGLLQLILDSQRFLLLLNLAQVVGHEEITAKTERMCELTILKAVTVTQILEVLFTVFTLTHQYMTSVILVSNL